MLLTVIVNPFRFVVGIVKPATRTSMYHQTPVCVSSVFWDLRQTKTKMDVRNWNYSNANIIILIEPRLGTLMSYHNIFQANGIQQCLQYCITLPWHTRFDINCHNHSNLYQISGYGNSKSIGKGKCHFIHNLRACMTLPESSCHWRPRHW